MTALAANQNKSARLKRGEWRQAIRHAVVTFESKEHNVKRGAALRAIANKLFEMALEGNLEAMKEIGNRLDGKPEQFIETSGDNPITLVKRVIVELPANSPGAKIIDHVAEPETLQNPQLIEQ